jgi:hypothetical protein
MGGYIEGIFIQGKNQAEYWDGNSCIFGTSAESSLGAELLP